MSPRESTSTEQSYCSNELDSGRWFRMVCVTHRNRRVVVRAHLIADGRLRTPANLNELGQALSKGCERILHRIRMPLCRIAMVVLGCLVWGLSTPAMACDHAPRADSAAIADASAPTAEAASLTHPTPLAPAISVAHAARSLPINKCPGACPGACCCHGGVASCSAAHPPGHESSAFQLPPATGTVRAGHKPEQAVRYREPLYGLDRPPKA